MLKENKTKKSWKSNNFWVTQGSVSDVIINAHGYGLSMRTHEKKLHILLKSLERTSQYSLSIYGIARECKENILLYEILTKNSKEYLK